MVRVSPYLFHNQNKSILHMRSDTAGRNHCCCVLQPLKFSITVKKQQNLHHRNFIINYSWQQ